MVDMNEILEICKVKYPIGCIFLSAYSGNQFTVKNNSYSISDDETGIEVNAIEEIGFVYLYYKGIYAEIISNETQSINNFSIW